MINRLDSGEKHLFFMGMRNSESPQRSGYEDIWKNHKWQGDWLAALPIRKWTDLDVWLYILWRDIDVNPKYFKGYTRVGCAIVCPYYSKSTWVLDKYWYPIMYNRWHNVLTQDFIENNKALVLNCTLEEYHLNWNGGVVRPEPTSEVIQEFADMNNLSYEIAEKYFGHECIKCGKRIKRKEDVAMNMKLLGRNVHKMLCKKHLRQEYDLDAEKWNQLINEFKAQGCMLF